MAFIFKLVAICIAATLTSAQLNYNNPVFIPEYIQTQSSYAEALQQPPTPVDGSADQSYLNFQQLPLPVAPKPFYTSEPDAVLKAPSEQAFVTNFNTQPYPDAPAQELQLPALAKWNPNNDPNLYYPIAVDKTVVPVVNQPTVLYPKKYSKNTLKVKPAAFKAKESVSAEKLAARQKQIDKALHTFAKQENKKQIDLEKAVENSDNVRKVNDPVPAESGFASFSSPSVQGPSSSSFTNSALTHGLASTGGHNGERMEFHIHGHDGPKTYKWGFDTGKGHNRHFRYEEKDKHGVVKGHYGYYDKHGKLRTVHYDSHPHEGFHASEGDHSRTADY